jgi:hypothetical protein
VRILGLNFAVFLNHFQVFGELHLGPLDDASRTTTWRATIAHHDPMTRVSISAVLSYVVFFYF